jgi:hypothetical protein
MKTNDNSVLNLNPERLNAGANMNEPSKKNTAVLPNLGYTSWASAILNSGKATIAKRLVIINGITFVTHQRIHTMNTASDLNPV